MKEMTRWPDDCGPTGCATLGFRRSESYVIMRACRGDGRQVERRYTVRLTVPRRGGWRAWGLVRADFEHALAAPADPASTSAEIASELRRGADYVRVTVVIALTVPVHRRRRRAGHRVGRLPQRRPR
jgi:hypothetical protein